MKHLPDIKVGDFIRIPNKKSTFEKEGETYSKSIYAVNSVTDSKKEIKKIHGNILKTTYNIFQVLKVMNLPPQA